MEFKNGTTVRTMDGKDEGSISRVVINPETQEVTHVVVHKGLLSDEERVIPMEHVASASVDEIDLSCTSDEFKDMSLLDVKKFGLRDEAQKLDRMGAGVMYGAPPANAYVIKETIRTIPDDLVALKEGAKVISADDHHVGNIEQIDADSGKMTDVVVSQGILLKTRKTVPVEWIKSFGDDEVRLTVSAERLNE